MALFSVGMKQLPDISVGGGGGGGGEESAAASAEVRKHSENNLKCESLCAFSS